jgi:nitric oxide reductase subunit C
VPGTRRFFVASLVVVSGTIAAMLVGIGVWAVTSDISAQAAAGYSVWRANGCEGCHTLFGQGGPYAPDLTHIFEQRGETYLREFMVNPNAFHPNQRLMPRFGLTVAETDRLIAFLDWVGQQETGWPPRPIQVSGGGTVVINDSLTSAFDLVPAGSRNEIPDNPVERGRYWFARSPANCAACHALEPDVVIVGPSLAGIATRASTRVPGQSAEQYIRNSMLSPGDFIVPGFQNVMVQNLADNLSSDQINDIIAFLMILE